MNHLSHLLLTLELLPIMRDTASSTGDGRIVIVSSVGHKSGEFNPSNMEGQQSYGRMNFYCNSKLYNVRIADYNNYNIATIHLATVTKCS